jgi:1,4-dihydroxy-2-naphthoate polyprenyltransferase
MMTAARQVRCRAADSPGYDPPIMSFGQRVATWRHIINTANLPDGAVMDRVSKWLIVTRAAVFSMTFTSGLIGGLLAIGSALPVNYWYLVLSVIGLVVAHAGNNMINDYFDLEGGVDTDEYVRALYAPHPILSGLLTKGQLAAAIIVANVIDLAILILLVAARGPLVAVFALAGLFVSVFYVAPPISLKRRGLGEPGVFLVWGPLMIGGTFFVSTGSLPAWIWVASLPYAILVTTVLFGKHIDKIVADTKLGVRTLPVILGEARSRQVGAWLMILFYPLTALIVIVGLVGPWVLLIALGIPRLLAVLKVFDQPKPDGPPPGYPERGWPLWFVGYAFIHTRRAGGLFTLGLLLNALLPVRLPWL